MEATFKTQNTIPSLRAQCIWEVPVKEESAASLA